MDCQQVQSHLSAYHDGELPDAMRLSVEEHLGSCTVCGAELATFDRLSCMSKSLAGPEPPDEIWAAVETALDADTAEAMAPPTPFRRRVLKRWRLGLWMAAAMVLLAVGIVWVTSGNPGHHHQLAADFEQYLEHFADTPETAQNLLLAEYEGRLVDLAQAETLVGYRPAVAGGLPEGYSLDATYVLKMPCCTCVQAICRGKDGRVFAIFEHSAGQAVCGGGRPANRVECSGHACVLTQVRNSLLTTWKLGQRQLTVVGARDLREIGDLAAHLAAAVPET
ncbi:MAG: zf-HC2 domain-containing protein [Thermoguttaceae bacterium]|jgi:anti-sigma factor RsiW